MDPYGSASIFIDSAVRSIADGGLLCVTCTDVSTLCGNNADACFYKYGTFSLKAPFCHEMVFTHLYTPINQLRLSELYSIVLNHRPTNIKDILFLSSVLVSIFTLEFLYA